MSGTKGDDSDNKREVERSTTKESGKTRKNHPSLISLAIARTASKPAGVFSMDAKKLIPGLYTGVLLDDDKTASFPHTYSSFLVDPNRWLWLLTI